jgi:hypothetical protein
MGNLLIFAAAIWVTWKVSQGYNSPKPKANEPTEHPHTSTEA